MFMKCQKSAIYSKIFGPESFFTLEIYLCGGLGLRPVRITPTHWVVTDVRTSGYTPWSHKFRI